MKTDNKLFIGQKISLVFFTIVFIIQNFLCIKIRWHSKIDKPLYQVLDATWKWEKKSKFSKDAIIQFWFIKNVSGRIPVREIDTRHLRHPLPGGSTVATPTVATRHWLPIRPTLATRHWLPRLWLPTVCYPF